METKKLFLSLRTFLFLCVTTVLMTYCGLRYTHIQTMEAYIDVNQELNIDTIEEDNLESFADKNDTRPAGIEQLKVPLFQSNESAEFPHVVNGTSRIPHIIHQICNTRLIPDLFHGAMKSFVKYNPSWQYRFWTYDSGRLLLKMHHPYLVEIYDKFGVNDVKKSDLLRYAILYEYGGVYADLDVENLRSLNKTTTNYACILPTEPFEHAAIIFNQGAIMTSSVLLCRPKHPFYKQLLLNLQLAKPLGHPVPVSGPVFITENYRRYNNITKADLARVTTFDRRTNTPYFYKGERHEENDDGIYIPNSQYFGDNIEPDLLNKDDEIKVCVRKPLGHRRDLKQRACKEFESRKTVRRQRAFTFCVHHWFHLWTKDQKHMRRLDIKEIVQTAVLYNG